MFILTTPIELLNQTFPKSAKQNDILSKVRLKKYSLIPKQKSSLTSISRFLPLSLPFSPPPPPPKKKPISAHKPHPDIIQQLKKRKSIVAYKEDIEHLAYNILSLAGSFGTIENAINTINQVREFQKYMPIFLDKYEIPYEKFSLDSGDYSKTFQLEKVLPRNSTQTLWGTNDLGLDVKKEVSNYMTNYP